MTSKLSARRRSRQRTSPTCRIHPAPRLDLRARVHRPDSMPLPRVPTPSTLRPPIRSTWYPRRHPDLGVVRAPPADGFQRGTWLRRASATGVRSIAACRPLPPWAAGRITGRRHRRDLAVVPARPPQLRIVLFALAPAILESAPSRRATPRIPLGHDPQSRRHRGRHYPHTRNRQVRGPVQQRLPRPLPRNLAASAPCPTRSATHARTTHRAAGAHRIRACGSLVPTPRLEIKPPGPEGRALLRGRPRDRPDTKRRYPRPHHVDSGRTVPRRPHHAPVHARPADARPSSSGHRAIRQGGAQAPQRPSGCPVTSRGLAPQTRTAIRSHRQVRGKSRPALGPPRRRASGPEQEPHNKTKPAASTACGPPTAERTASSPMARHCRQRVRPCPSPSIVGLPCIRPATSLAVRLAWVERPQSPPRRACSRQITPSARHGRRPGAQAQLTFAAPVDRACPLVASQPNAAPCQG